MSLIEELKINNYALIASNGYHSTDSGIKPVISKINENIDYFNGLDVADKIIGKASAMLFALSKPKSIECIVLSETGQHILEKYKIPYKYEVLTKQIINRKGDDICPMEKAVKDIDDLNDALVALNNTISTLSAK